MKRSIYVLAIIFALCLSVTTAGAATVVKLDMPTLVDNSDVIVIAQVTGQRSKLEEDGRVYTTITFRTDDTLKGAPGAEFSIRQIGGHDVQADIATHVPGMPGFRDHERVFLFLRHIEDRPVITGMAQGKFQIAVGPDHVTDYVIPQIKGSHLISPEDSRQRLQIDEQDHRETFHKVHIYDHFRQQVEDLIGEQPGGSQ